MFSNSKAAKAIFCSSLLIRLSEEGVGATCSDPITSILTTLKCVEEGNATCASAGYNSAKFVKLHNGIDTNTTIDAGGSFWEGAFALTRLELDINHQMNAGANQASLRYVEKVTFTDGPSLGLPPSEEYPFGQVYLQHEHALVTVDDDCRMTLWDQYGDNTEQIAVDITASAMLCKIGFLPAEVCSPPEAEPGTGDMTGATEAPPVAATLVQSAVASVTSAPCHTVCESVNATVEPSTEETIPDTQDTVDMEGGEESGANYVDEDSNGAAILSANATVETSTEETIPDAQNPFDMEGGEESGANDVDEESNGVAILSANATMEPSTEETIPDAQNPFDMEGGEDFEPIDVDSNGAATLYAEYVVSVVAILLTVANCM